MSSVLNISVTSDARELFVQYDVATIKKIKATALDEINHKKTVLRNFIGDNYRPLLDTPPVLKQIQGIFEETKDELRRLESFGRDFETGAAAKEAGKENPVSAAAQLYLDARNHMDASEFKVALECAVRALELLEKAEESGRLARSLKLGVDALPKRIFARMGKYLVSPSSEVTVESLVDCFEATEMLVKVFPAVTARQSACEFLSSSVIKRAERIVDACDQTNELCLAFIGLLEVIVTFLAATKRRELRKMLEAATEAFKRQTNACIAKFAECELRDILRNSKTIEDALRNKLALPNMVSAVQDLALRVDFWNDAFVGVLGALAAQAIQFSLSKLSLGKCIERILNSSSSETFNALNFAMGSSGDLKTRSLGLSPEITKLQTQINSTILQISSQLQSQVVRIAGIEMLKQPLTVEVQSVGNILKNAVQRSPLSACLLASVMCSPTIANLVDESTMKLITQVQDMGATEWAKRKATQLKPILDMIPRTGAAFSFLFELEKSLLEAGGQNSNVRLDLHLRAEAYSLVVAWFTASLDGMVVDSGSREQVRANEAKAELLFRDFHLLSRVLSTSGHLDTRKACISKMDPINIEATWARIETSVEAEIYQCRGLIKLISGGRQIAEPKHNPDFDEKAHLSALFGD